VSFSPFHVNQFLLNDFIISSSLLSADLKQTIGLMLFALVKMRCVSLSEMPTNGAFLFFCLNKKIPEDLPCEQKQPLQHATAF
jgi:hypothetical protein